MSLDTRLQKSWYVPGATKLWLLPLAWLFKAIMALRRWAFGKGWLASYKLTRPVIVVGNLTVGGTGKTPMVIWLANSLTSQGYRVGVISRGYGGKARSWPQVVLPNSEPAQLGDEPVLIAQQTNAMVYAGPDRVAAARQAIAAGAEVIISDDGLQHYRLQRDVELVVIDASRMFGNGRLLPAGPLREPQTRLQSADLVLLNQRGVTAMPPIQEPHVAYRVGLTRLRSLRSGELRELSSLRGQQVHVVTGIGNPESFINALRQHDIRLDARILPDHAALTVDDIEFGDALPVLMTEKDAVKCRRFVGARHWAVGAEVLLDAADQQRLLDCVQQALARQHTN